MSESMGNMKFNSVGSNSFDCKLL
jgi:hypothetical protein